MSLSEPFSGHTPVQQFEILLPQRSENHFFFAPLPPALARRSAVRFFAAPNDASWRAARSSWKPAMLLPWQSFSACSLPSVGAWPQLFSSQPRKPQFALLAACVERPLTCDVSSSLAEPVRGQ